MPIKTEKMEYNILDASNPDDLNEKIIPLSSPLNCILFFFFQLFSVFTVVATSVLILNFYIAKWGVSIIWNTNVMLLRFIVGVYTRLIVAYYGDR